MITLQYLEERFWTITDILRDELLLNQSIDYLLRLLLFKRLCDVFEEEKTSIEKRTGNHDLIYSVQSSHQFFIPEYALWKNLHTYPNIGKALDIVTREVEAHNPILQGIFTSIDFNRFDDSGRLLNLVAEFSHLNLQNSNLAEPGLLGRAYDSIIEKFSTKAGKASETFFIPQNVTELLVRLLDIQQEMSICDPTCGTGSFLVACANYIKNEIGGLNNVLLYGEEKSNHNLVIAKINLLLHDIFDFDIRQGNIIRDPQLVKDNKLMRFDRVIASPPFNLSWSYENADFNYYSRFRYGIPPKNNANFIFIQHILAALKEDGKAGVIVPLGVLFRSGKEGLIRKRIVEDDLIEAVIGLPANLLIGTTLPIAILILTHNKVEKRKNKILFIDATNQYQKIRNQNYLPSDAINRIITVYQSFSNKEGYARVVTLKELAENDYMLNINRYVLPSNLEDEEINIDTKLIKLRELETKRTLAENDMNKYLRELGVNIEV